MSKNSNCTKWSASFVALNWRELKSWDLRRMTSNSQYSVVLSLLMWHKHSTYVSYHPAFTGFQQAAIRSPSLHSVVYEDCITASSFCLNIWGSEKREVVEEVVKNKLIYFLKNEAYASVNYASVFAYSCWTSSDASNVLMSTCSMLQCLYYY